MSDIEDMIEDCERRESRMNDWERGFIDSASHDLEKNGSLSPGQVAKLNEIWDKVTEDG